MHPGKSRSIFFFVEYMATLSIRKQKVPSASCYSNTLPETSEVSSSFLDSKVYTKGAPCPRCVYAALHACDVALRIRRVPWHTLTAPTLADMLLGTLMEDEEGLTRSEAH